MLLESMLPRAARSVTVRRPKPVKWARPAGAKGLDLNATKTRAKAVRWPRPARPAVTTPSAPAPVPPLPGVWQKSWFSTSLKSPAGGAKRMLYWLYLSAKETLVSRPLVVMLHGCQQTASEFAAATHMNALAERKGFAVLYPQQSVASDAHRCWHWYKRATQQGQGDVALIADMIAQVRQKHGLDASRTYVVGLSTGAALASIVALRHPALIAAVGLHSAPVYGTTDSAMSAYRAMQHGSR